MRKYIAYLYQYNNMKRPAYGAVHYTDNSAWDLLPPTVIWHTGVEAKNKREAIRIAKGGILKCQKVK